MRWRSNGSERQTVPLNEEHRSIETVDPITQLEDGDQDCNFGNLERQPGGATEHLESANQRPEEEEDGLGRATGVNVRDRKRPALDSQSSFTAASNSEKGSQLNPVVIEDDDPGLDHALPEEEMNTVWRPQSEQSTCEFTYTIRNYAQKREGGCKKAEYSPTTVDEFGNRWRLIVYVNGNGRASNNHLSLFLQVADADDLPFGWKKAVSYVLTLEHPDGSNLGYAKRNPDKTFKLCPKAIDWGWSQFITSDRIQQEGYISNDSLSVRASVTVKSSSVSIDPEDAELYLKCAVEEGNSDAVEICLTQGAGVNCQFKDDLYTPLHTACSSSTVSGSLGVLDLLLERGADCNACNKWRETPLLIAANNGHTAAVEALLRSSADPSLCSEAGWSALTFAAHKGYDDIVALLLKAGAPVNCQVIEDLSTPLHKACAGGKPGHLSAAKQLLEGGADIHALNKWRETPLLTAANHGQAKIVDALLKAGADPCMCTDTGWSPLSIAAYKGHDAAVRLLLEEGAPTEEEDPTLSALLQAATKGLPDTVELLLRHGADHTVTTKKGDTALSILVEQNLIDAAVEMVTEYKASIPRCSRDRKKVQRARLLINLRLKQQQREGLLSVSTDDETDCESEGSRSALHDNGNEKASHESKKRKKARSCLATAEAQARAAEEALLMELDQEDAKAQKDEAAANSKRAKKKKKKERERLQKLKEEQERREREEKEAKERERQQKLHEEKERKEREQRERKAQEENERLMREAAEREKHAAAKKREREERDKIQRERDRRDRTKGSSKISASSSFDSPLPERGGKGNARSRSGKKNSQRGLNSPSPDDLSLGSPKTVTSPRPSKPSAGNRTRGWEGKKTSPPITKQNSKDQKLDGSPSQPQSVQASNGAEVVMTAAVQPQQKESTATVSRSVATVVDFSRTDATSQDRSAQDQEVFASPRSIVNGSSTEHYESSNFEHPAISLVRREKLSEILQRCAIARTQPGSTDPLSVVNDRVLKVVIYRWVVRAAHNKEAFMDCLIPSWVDIDLLTAFFQRQFISESRKGLSLSRSSGIVSMEALKEAGSAMALFCHNQAKALQEVGEKFHDQLPSDWTDSHLGFAASEVTGNVIIDWANRAQVLMPSSTFSKLRKRYGGPPNRMLATLFRAKMRYDIMGALASGTTMDYRLTASTLACLARDAGVSMELWSDPFTVLEEHAYCGRFLDIDCPFGGLPPFGKEGWGGETRLLNQGASISVMPPFDSMIASLYVRTLVDMMEACDKSAFPVSCVLILHADCFHDLHRPPTTNDITLLDPRLNDHYGSYVRFAETLPTGHHKFSNGISDVAELCESGSLLVIMQNEAGKERFVIRETNVLNIIQSMGVNVLPTNDIPLAITTAFSDNHATNEPPDLPQVAYHESVSRLAPRRREAVSGSEFGAIGGETIGAPVPNDERRTARRGRLFDLIDDGEEEAAADLDVVSGMLNNLNLFQSNPTQDIDIEAISLMGIGGAPLGEDTSLGGLASGGSRTTSRFVG